MFLKDGRNHTQEIVNNKHKFQKQKNKKNKIIIKLCLFLKRLIQSG